MTDIVERLRGLSRYAHDDLSIGDEAADEIERLRQCLRWQEDRDGRMGTHSVECYTFGHRHYECALSEIERLRAELDHFTNSGIIEVAVRNASVSEYMRHWEGRALSAEAKRKPLSQEAALALATKQFPRWREDIQEQFVIQLLREFERAHGIGDESAVLGDSGSMDLPGLDGLALPKLRRRKRSDDCDVPALCAPYESDVLMSNLLPLPEPATQEAIWHDSCCEWSQYHDASDPMPKEWDGPAPDEVLSYFTADQMRTYGEACAVVEREACAMLVQTQRIAMLRNEREGLAQLIRARGEV